MDQIQKERFLTILRVIIRILLVPVFLMLGLVVTVVTSLFSIPGLQIEILRGGGHFDPSLGFPIAWLSEIGMLQVPAGVDYGAITVDTVFWAAVLYLGLYLTKKYYRRKKEE